MTTKRDNEAENRDELKNPEPEPFFKAPKHERTKAFLSQILH